MRISITNMPLKPVSLYLVLDAFSFFYESDPGVVSRAGGLVFFSLFLIVEQPQCKNFFSYRIALS